MGLPCASRCPQPSQGEEGTASGQEPTQPDSSLQATVRARQEGTRGGRAPPAAPTALPSAWPCPSGARAEVGPEPPPSQCLGPPSLCCLHSTHRHTHSCTRTHTQLYLYARTHSSPHVHTCNYTYTFTSIHTRTHALTATWAHTLVHTCTLTHTHSHNAVPIQRSPELSTQAWRQRCAWRWVMLTMSQEVARACDARDRGGAQRCTEAELSRLLSFQGQPPWPRLSSPSVPHVPPPPHWAAAISDVHLG